MIRATVLIGIGNSRMPGPLPAVAGCLAAMRAWVEAQPGFGSGNERRLQVLSDEGGPVSNVDIYNAVKRFIEKGTITQLVIYFVGHGMMRGRDEFWLCSGADDNPNEFVDVPNSREVARACGVPHVVILSDACRTLTSDAKFNAVSGSIIFPYPKLAGGRTFVDMLYGASIGEAALETEIAGAALPHQSLFTTAVVAGLRGDVADLNRVYDGERCVAVQDLALYLEQAVPRRLFDLRLNRYVQRPDDDISSRHPQKLSWLGEPASAGGVATAPARAPRPGAEDNAVVLKDIAGIAYLRGIHAIRSEGGGATRDGAAETVVLAAPKERIGLARLRRWLAAPTPNSWEMPPPLHYGDAYIDSFGVSRLTTGSRDDDKAGGIMRIDVEGWCTVLMEFADGRGLAVPVVAGHALRVHYNAHTHRLRALYYLPRGDRNARLPRHKFAVLTTVHATATGAGPEIRDEATLRELIRYLLAASTPDPMLFCLSANILSKTPLRDEVGALDARFASCYGFHLLDLAILASAPPLRRAVPDRINPMPLTSRAWNVLETAFNGRAGLLAASELKRQHVPMAQSFWTLLEPAGVEAVRNLIIKGSMT